MQKALFFLAISVFFTNNILTAQYWQTDAKWIYYQDEFMPDPEEEYLQIQKIRDTLVLGKNAVLLREEFVRIWQNNVNIDFTSHHIVLAENRKVFYYEAIDSSFHSLYDFTLGVRDTMRSYCYWSQSYTTNIIDSISSISFAGESRTVFHISPVNNTLESCNLYGEIIEGIGPIPYLLPRPGFVDPPPGGFLICYKENGYYYPPSALDCSLVSTENLKAKAYPFVFPNPTNGTLFINGEGALDVEVFDLQGRLKVEFQRISQIDMSDFPAQWYVLRVKNGKQSTIFRVLKI